jgi:CheY-like chemotaxis protein
MDTQGRTALGAARDRFARSLAQRARELKELVSSVRVATDDGDARERLRRRVHALYASAQVFQDEALAARIKQVVGRLDAARDMDRALNPADLDAVSALATELAGAATAPEGGAEVADGSRVPVDSRISSVFMPSPLLEPAPAAAGRGGEDPDTHERTLALTRSVAGLLSPPYVVALLVVASARTQDALRAALPLERFELSTTEEPVTAAEVLDNVAPDLVLVDPELLGADAAEQVRRLRGPRTGLVRAVACVTGDATLDADDVVERTGADALLRLPMDPDALCDELQRLAGATRPGSSQLAALEGGTVDEIAGTVAEEIRRGIVESLREGRRERIELSDHAELMAATWSAIGRIRAHLAGQTRGRVRFSDHPYARGPAELALTDDLPAAPYVGAGDALRGRRVIVADDDPAVIWFFAGVLRESGAVVMEADNGRQALELARRRTPDLVISDILMPGVDGFALCQELDRDLALAHVPVILISWKEDFLRRMRELDAGASGYLRKEAGSHQILEAALRALQPRLELEALLSAGDEVRGRVERMGVRRLVETVAARRPDARVSVRDALNLFEVELRQGNRVAVTRTAADGSFSRGGMALRQLLGVEAGRFTVSTAEGPLRGAFDAPLDKVLADAERALAAVLDAVSDRFLMRIARVDLADEQLGTLLSATPTILAEVVTHLRKAEHPVSRLLTHGSFSARELERHLRELARRGAVRRVFDAEGHDLVAEAERLRRESPGELMHASERPAQQSLPPTVLDEEDVQWLPGAGAEAAGQAGMVVETAGGQAHDVPAAAPDEPLREAPPRLQDLHSPERAAVPNDVGQTPAAGRAAAGEGAAVPHVDERSSVIPVPPPLSVGEAQATDAALEATVEPSPTAAPPGGRDAAGFAVRSSLFEHPRPSGAPPPPQRGSFWSTAAMGAAFAAIGYFGWQAAVLDRRPATAPEPRPTPTQSEDPGAEPSPGEGGPRPAGGSDSSGGGPALARPAPAPSMGRVLPFIDRSRGVDVAADEGLLLVEFEGQDAPKLRIGKRQLGAAPLAIALEAGRHELVIERDGETSFRFLTIRPGETRIIDL